MLIEVLVMPFLVNCRLKCQCSWHTRMFLICDHLLKACWFMWLCHVPLCLTMKHTDWHQRINTFTYMSKFLHHADIYGWVFSFFHSPYLISFLYTICGFWVEWIYELHHVFSLLLLVLLLSEGITAFSLVVLLIFLKIYFIIHKRFHRGYSFVGSKTLASF